MVLSVNGGRRGRPRRDEFGLRLLNIVLPNGHRHSLVVSPYNGTMRDKASLSVPQQVLDRGVESAAAE